MSLTKLPLGRNNSVMTSLFPPRESLVVTSRLGTVYNTVRRVKYCSIRGDPHFQLLSFHRALTPSSAIGEPSLPLSLFIFFLCGMSVIKILPSRRERGGGLPNETTAKYVCNSSNVIYPPRTCGRVCTVQLSSEKNFLSCQKDLV